MQAPSTGTSRCSGSTACALGTAPIRRQSKSVTFEAPFLFLLFGNDRALLLDTGATKEPDAFPLRETVDDLVATWLTDHPRSEYRLVVAHSHGHGDHVAGDGQLADRPHTTVVGKQLDAVQSFFGFTDWPDQVVTFDLGGRVLELTGTPGLHPTSVAVFDPWSGFLLTGDTVYPGRLYDFVIASGMGPRTGIPLLLRSFGQRLRARLPGGR